MEIRNVNVDDLVKNFLVKTINLVPHEPMCERDVSFSWDGMQTSNRHEVDSKHDVASLVVIPLSKIESTFVWDNMDNPILMDDVFFPIQDMLQTREVIRIPSKGPPYDVPKKSKRGVRHVPSNIVGDVPCVVCCDKNILVLFENCIFGNIVAQDDLYNHFGTQPNRLAISCVRKEENFIWNTIKHRNLR